jgi:hypothetical protein
MKLKLHLPLIIIVGLLHLLPVNAQLTPKNLETLVYDGQGNPTAYKFGQLNTIKDSVTYTQTAEGFNVVTKSAPWIPVTWFATSDSGFVANGAYTVEARVAVAQSMKNGFFIEMQGAPGKRFKIDIDSAAIYNMTYSPSTAKEVIANNLDNKGMHTYRVAVDNADMAHIYRDGVKIGTAEVDGLVSSSAYYKDVEVIQDDQFFEDYIESFNPAFPSPLAYATHATLKGSLANFDITYSTWCYMGIDTVQANVKVGATSMWFNNGTTGELKILKKGLEAGKYKLSFWSKTKAAGEAYKGSVKYIGTDPNRPAVKSKLNPTVDSIPAYIGTDPDVILLPSAVLVPDNRNFNYREYAFDLIKDGDIMVTFHNGWSNTQKPGWANIWFDDLRIAKVEPVPFIRFGKDSEAGVTDFTLGSLTYDLTGAYSPAPTGINETQNTLNTIYTTHANSMLQVNYTLANDSKTSIQLVDLSGRVLFQQNEVAFAGKNTSSINTAGMKGVYLLRVITAQEAKTLKVEVK